MDDKGLTDLVKATRALLLVQLQDWSETDNREKPEIILARAGYTAREIAELINKNADAVAKAIQRAGKVAR